MMGTGEIKFNRSEDEVQNGQAQLQSFVDKTYCSPKPGYIQRNYINCILRGTQTNWSMSLKRRWDGQDPETARRGGVKETAERRGSV